MYSRPEGVKEGGGGGREAGEEGGNDSISLSYIRDHGEENLKMKC